MHWVQLAAQSLVEFEVKLSVSIPLSPGQSTSQNWEEAKTLAAHSGGGEYSAHTGRTVEGGAEGRGFVSGIHSYNITKMMSLPFTAVVISQTQATPVTVYKRKNPCY